ncbi:hypothetical protein Salat_0187000 [Sesamum alatum]|uniref:Uncharacterized protein n=1 Tax=Sesamum alatum TaxID=300844 RepID=A0AAE1YZE5_9LAMI|nr:hypothetical protein Salat_0187000 [Sesamum alatum]
MSGFPAESLSPSITQKLILTGCQLPWEDMTIVDSLPNLEVLKLRNDAFQGSTWATNEGEFCRLKFLSLDHMMLEHWMSESRHFPSLERLVIRWCFFLVEIPRDFG